MPKRRFDLPVTAQNPFDAIGMDKAFLEILINSGDDEVLATALTGLKRVVARTLHPDTGVQTDSATSYLDAFMQAQSKLEEMALQDITTLAKAHVRRRGSMQPRKKQEFFESEDLHDGALLRDLFDVVAESGESIPSLRNKRILVRPLNFSMSKPQGATEGAYQWFPPDAAQISMFETNASGETTWTAMRQTSFSGMLRKELRQNDVTAELKTKVAQISTDYWPVVEQFISRDQILKDETVVIHQKDGYVHVYLPSGKLAGVVDIGNIIETKIDDGAYAFGFENYPSHGYPAVIDSYYIFDESIATKERLLLTGFSDKSYLSTQQKQIYDDPRKNFGEILPSTSRLGDDMYSFNVPPKMHKYLQRSYTPQVPADTTRSLVLATNLDHEVLVLGQLIKTTDIT